MKSDDPVLEKNYNEQFNSTSFSSGIYKKYENHTFRLSYSGAYRAPHSSNYFQMDYTMVQIVI